MGRRPRRPLAAGESLIITGPQGVCKSTLAQQLVLARAGILNPELIGFSVAPETRRCVLYLACDRPRQIARSFRRMVEPKHGDLLRERVRIWRGPLPFDLVANPEGLAALAEEGGAGTVVIDSLKDLASPLSSDDVGSAVNRALAHLIARDIEVVVIHHNRKATSENKKPKQLADVYGSTWITSGSGSVISLWGEAGDPLVELTHLKQPAEDVGPLELEHDHVFGTTRLRERVDARSVLAQAGDDGATARDVAVGIHGKPSKAQIEKARRVLDRLVEMGLATRSTAPEGPGMKVMPVVFRQTPQNSPVDPAWTSTWTRTQGPWGSTNPIGKARAGSTHPSTRWTP
jgi:replicative DNA helicase